MSTEQHTTEEIAGDWFTEMFREDPATEDSYAELCRVNAELEARAAILADGRFVLKLSQSLGHFTEFSPA